MKGISRKTVFYIYEQFFYTRLRQIEQYKVGETEYLVYDEVIVIVPTVFDDHNLITVKAKSFMNNFIFVFISQENWLIKME